MIAYANMDGSYLEAFDKDGHRLWSTYVGSDAQIVGSTATTVSVKVGDWIDTYDEKGSKLSSNHV